LFWISKILSSIMPRFQFNLGLDNDNVSRDPVVVNEINEDTLCQSMASARWGNEIMKAQDRILKSPGEIRCPLLMLYGTADTTVPLDLIESFFKEVEVEDKTLKVFPGGYHDLQHDLDKEELLNLFKDWILERV
jgi:acylglycerol lipase